MSARETPAGSGRAKAAGPLRIAAYLGLLLLGAVVGAAGSLVQGGWFPGGLLLALLASAGLFLGSARAVGTQLAVLASGAGWLVTVLWLSGGRPEGDGVFSAGIGPIIYIIGGMTLAVMCATMARSTQPGGTSTRLDR
ncbi:hypothetical protein GCM10010387_40850 [Streptomyces inusitatus]|uniref:Integral membrane protein n=1 Tax=Streptomyces inusitatus TaxID=68221 RepID=A0A918QG22_9ACTN|nr:DUF6113 family protein [Streptomyces inusitatus]GGZ42393.1 hypothetical protein GCM10010387_40850 [Streptomyces inusitatus]